MFDNSLCLYPFISRACICRCRLTEKQTVVLFEVLFTIQLNRKGRNKLSLTPQKNMTDLMLTKKAEYQQNQI